MRCKYCGSEALHSDVQHKGFSTGKAAAGFAVFGVAGVAAGAIGKNIDGYRCASCGQFSKEPMDSFTAADISVVIVRAKSGNMDSKRYILTLKL